MTQSLLKLKRVYQKKEKDDGRRVLVDRVWPRGVSKENAALDEWLKDVAPSSSLRKWFGHRPERFEQFAKEYKKELNESEERRRAVRQILQWLDEGTVTLLYAAKDEKYNHVRVLADVLQEEAREASFSLRVNT